MPAQVICLSGQIGTGLQEIAAAVGERLGYRVVDDEIVLRAAAEAGVDSAVVADVEQRRSLLERALEALSPTGDAATFTLSGIGAVPALDAPATDDLRALIRAAIEETAGQGRVVIVSHAASHALAGRDGVLRVLVAGSPGVRQARLADDQGVDAKDAADAVAFSDKARADYLRSFYGVKREEPSQYDIVVNTDRFTVAEAVQLVVLAAGG